MNTEKIHLKKDEIHKKIDDSFNIILKGMDSIFNKIKFNEEQIVEDANNLEILTSTDLISSNLIELVNLVNDMKVELLKKNDYNYNTKKQITNEVNKSISDIKNKLLLLQENYNYIVLHAKECKSNKFFKQSLTYDINE